MWGWYRTNNSFTCEESLAYIQYHFLRSGVWLSLIVKWHWSQIHFSRRWIRRNQLLPWRNDIIISWTLLRVFLTNLSVLIFEMGCAMATDSPGRFDKKQIDLSSIYITRIFWLASCCSGIVQHLDSSFYLGFMASRRLSPGPPGAPLSMIRWDFWAVNDKRRTLRDSQHNLRPYSQPRRQCSSYPSRMPLLSSWNTFISRHIMNAGGMSQ